MTTSVFETRTRDVGAASTRRTILQLLGGAATLGALIVTGQAHPAATRHRSGKRGKRNKHGTQTLVCQPGARVDSFNVPPSGVAASTVVLAAGQRYRLRASGFWSTNATDGNDAAAAFSFATPNAPVRVAGGVRVGLAIDGGSPDVWGNYTLSHLYEHEVLGQGKALALNYVDPITADNSGSVLVEIFCA